MFKSTYSEKLRDPRWQKLRLEVMKRDDFTCQACGDKKTTLNVNHLKYHGDPWQTPICFLETLCEPCHKKRTEINQYCKSLGTKELFFIFDSASAWAANNQQQTFKDKVSKQERYSTEELFRELFGGEIPAGVTIGDEDLFSEESPNHQRRTRSLRAIIDPSEDPFS